MDTACCTGAINRTESDASQWRSGTIHQIAYWISKTRSCRRNTRGPKRSSQTCNWARDAVAHLGGLWTGWSDSNAETPALRNNHPMGSATNAAVHDPWRPEYGTPEDGLARHYNTPTSTAIGSMHPNMLCFGRREKIHYAVISTFLGLYQSKIKPHPLSITKPHLAMEITMRKQVLDVQITIPNWSSGWCQPHRPSQCISKKSRRQISYSRN
eukprot:1875033-Amphidinium_carterae.4